MELIDTLLAHVINTLGRCSFINHSVIVSPDTEGWPERVLVMPDSGEGLNATLSRTVTNLRRRGASRIVVLPMDLPLLTCEDLVQLVTGSERTGLALAPDRHGIGTNAICLATRLPFHFQFGSGSFARHLREGRACGAAAAVVVRPGLAWDLDEESDLCALRELVRVRSSPSARLCPGAAP